MGLGTLTDRSSGQTILEGFFNDIHSAMEGDWVPRNSSGVPTPSGGSLGTAAFPWQTLRADALVVGGASVDVSQVAAPPYRVISGRTRTTSNQPQFLDPAGAAGGASVTVQGASTSLVYDVNGSTITLSSDIVKGSLTTAPNTNNTATVNDAAAADQASTRTWGEINGEKDITVTSVGSEIVSRDGLLSAFKINDGTNDEYFIGIYDNTNTLIKECFRGFFYNSSGTPINRIAFANSDTITLMNLGYLFLDSDGATVDVTYNQPVYSFSSPGSPATGDYWYDLGNNLWKRYDGATFQIVTRTFIGYVVIDDTDCVAARSVEFDARYKPENDISLQIDTTEILRSVRRFAKVNVAGNEIQYNTSKVTWNMTTDIAAIPDSYSGSEGASTVYYAYITDEGDEKISDIEPYLRFDLSGWYHPHNPWLCVGIAFNDSSSDLVSVASRFKQSLTTADSGTNSAVGTVTPASQSGNFLTMGWSGWKWTVLTASDTDATNRSHVLNSAGAASAALSYIQWQIGGSADMTSVISDFTNQESLHEEALWKYRQANAGIGNKAFQLAVTTTGGGVTQHFNYGRSILETLFDEFQF